jgi:hypothetical protein
MSNKNDDGGPAFPHSVAVAPSGDVYGSDYFGGCMSLRDWFAGQALAGLLANASNQVDARVAYAIADAMLVARKGKGET